MEPEMNQTPNPSVVESQVESTSESSEKEGMHRKDRVRKLSRKTLIILLAVVVMLVCSGAIGIYFLTNNYMTPVYVLLHDINTPDYNPEKYFSDCRNGLAASSFRKIDHIMHSSNSYMDGIEEWIDGSIRVYDDNIQKYGSDYKYEIRVDGKTALSASELREYRACLQDAIDSCLTAWVDESEDYSASQWSWAAEAFDLTKADTKELFRYLESAVDELGRLQVSAGYELDCTAIITGEYLDEPEEQTRTLTVLKVNGRWIMGSMTKDDIETYTFETSICYWDLLT